VFRVSNFIATTTTRKSFASLTLSLSRDDTHNAPSFKTLFLVFGRERREREKNIFWVFEHHHREEYHTTTTVVGVVLMMMMRE